MKSQRCILVSGLAMVAMTSLVAVADVVTLMPVADTALFEQVPGNNLGASQSLAAGNTASESATRALVKFDLRDALPAGAKVTAARLELKVVRAPFLVEPATFHAHRLLVDWGEGDKGADSITGTGGEAGPGEATWNSRFNGESLWTTAGGAAGADYVSQVSAPASISTGDTLSFSSSDLAADVQRWVDSPDSNFGWLIKDQFESSSTTARRLGSREHPTSPPKLEIQFEAPLSILRSVIKDGKFCLTFLAQSRGYVVEARDAVDSGEWQTIATIPASDVPTELEICDPAPVTGARFYRLMEL